MVFNYWFYQVQRYPLTVWIEVIGEPVTSALLPGQARFYLA